MIRSLKVAKRDVQKYYQRSLVFLRHVENRADYFQSRMPYLYNLVTLRNVDRHIMEYDLECQLNLMEVVSREGGLLFELNDDTVTLSL